MNSFIFSSKNPISWILVALFTAVVSLCIFFGATELLIRSQVNPNDNFQKHLKFFFSQPSENIVIGDSHVALGFTGVDGFANLGYPADNVPIFFGKTELYMEKVPLKRVILQADPSIFAGYREAADSQIYLRDFREGGKVFFELLSPWHRKYTVDYWVVFIKGILQRKKAFTNIRSFESDGSQMTQDEMLSLFTEKELKVKVTEKVVQQEPIQGFETSKSGIAYKALVEKLVRAGVKVCLVTFPSAPSYRELAKSYPGYEKAFMFFDELSRQHGTARANFWQEFNDYSLFSDQDHLNQKGAKILGKLAVKKCFPDLL